MSQDQTVAARRPIGVLVVLTFLLSVAKASGFISAPWWLILIPLWLPVAILVGIFAVVFVAGVVTGLAEHVGEGKRRKERVEAGIQRDKERAEPRRLAAWLTTPEQQIKQMREWRRDKERAESSRLRLARAKARPGPGRLIQGDLRPYL